ncbi:lipocalin-like domain-containing protein [Verticiella alkaliphila]|uniref:lipocalin-like domain-containing protein n=1 Tax=Verticiella alkaliphila TaxID=2779529 RepID=UPI001C0BFC36
MSRFLGRRAWLRLSSAGMLMPLVGCGREDAARPAAGFAGLGEAAGSYLPVQRGRPLVFPQDHDAHDGYRIEWWYVTANLRDEAGHDWGVQWTLFRSAIRPGQAGEGWHSPNLWMAHAALTGPGGHQHAERLARGGIGQADVQVAPFRAGIDDWALEAPVSAAPAGQDALARLQMTARGDGFAYSLALASDAPLVLHGDAGYSEKSGAGQASYYYSQPFYRVTGEVIRDGKAVAVTGRAWLDREWSSQPLAPEQEGWDWFSLHLANGDKLMVFQVRQRDGSHYRAGTWIRPDGQQRALASGEIGLEARTRSRQVHGREVPTTWAVRVPVAGVDTTVTALVPQAWMCGTFPYWEGPVRINGAGGMGYLEMTGY